MEKYNHFLTTILNSLEDALVIVAENNQVVWINEQFEKIWKIEDKQKYLNKELDLLTNELAKKTINNELFIKSSQEYTKKRTKINDKIILVDHNILIRKGECLKLPNGDSLYIWTYKKDYYAVCENLENELMMFEDIQMLERMAAWRYNSKTEKIAFSKGIVDILGIKPDTEIKIINLEKIIEKKFFEDFLSAVSLATEKKKKFELFGEVNDLKDQKKWVRISGEEIDVNAEGVLLGVIQDVTTKLHKEYSDKKSVERMNHVTSLTNIATWDYDIKNQIVEWSEQVESVLGYKLEELGADFAFWHKIMAPEDLQLYKISLEEHLAYGLPFSLEVKIQQKSSQWKWLEVSGNAIARDKNGSPLRMLAVLTDVSEKKNIIHERNDIEKKFETIFKHVGTGIAILNGNGEILQANPYFRNLIKMEKHLEKEINFITLLPPSDRDKFKNAIKRVANEKIIEKIETRCMRFDGKLVWINITCTPVEYKNKVNNEVIALIEDITERKNALEKLQYESVRDSMTGALNHQNILDTIEKHVSLAKRHARPLVVCFCDLDDFKVVNDLYGHTVGDKVIIEFVRIVSRIIRNEDYVGRYGGEEFAILFPETNLAGALNSLNRVKDIFRSHVFLTDKQEKFTVTASYGLAEIQAGMDVGNIIKAADLALYDAKNNGKDQIVCWNGNVSDLINTDQKLHIE